MYQYEYKSSDVLKSKKKVAVYDDYIYYYPEDSSGWEVNFGWMQTAPDGKIYITSTSGGNRKLGQIAKPNKDGKLCDVRQHNIHIPTSFARTLPFHPNFRLGPLDGSPCDTLGLDNNPVAKFRYEVDTNNYLRVEFFDLSYFRPTKWRWDFGDGAKSQVAEPIHPFKKNGVYNVCLTVSNENSSNTSCKEVTIGTSSFANHDLRFSKVVSVFPNTTDGPMLVTLSDYIPEKGNFILYDMMGREVMKSRVYYGWNSLDIGNLNSGHYLYKVVDGYIKIGEGKIIKF